MLLRRALVFFRGADDFLALDPFEADPRLAIAGPRLAALFLAGAFLVLFLAALFFAALLRAADLPADLRAGPLRAGALRALLFLAPVDLRLLPALLEPPRDDFLAAAMFHAPII